MSSQRTGTESTRSESTGSESAESAGGTEGGGGDRGTWVYGVVPAGASLDELQRRGDDLPDVWVVEAGDLGAVVGPVPADDARATRDQALAHAQVLDAAVADAPVVPFRFGTVVEGGDEEVGTQLLEDRHDQLAQLLDRVRDRVQLTLKVTYRDDVVLREIVESEPEIGQLREEIDDLPEDATRDARLRLGELVSAALEQLREQDAAELLAQLEPAAVDVSEGPMEDELMVLNVDLLVDRARQDELEAAIDEVAGSRQERMRFRLLGPMPAYSFVGQLSQDGQEGQGGQSGQTGQGGREET
jgi:hypothetical protein